MAAAGKGGGAFCVLGHQASLWLLCNVHFVQNTQRTRLWGYVKDRVFVPPLPRDLAVLKAQIIAAMKNIDALLLTRVWQELEYRIDVCRVTRGAHIDHL
jgi:hypothetical protein